MAEHEPSPGGDEQLKPLQEARSTIFATVPALPVEPTPVSEALGLVLAQPVTATDDVPPFTNSAMDGYAVKGDDVGTAPVTLDVIGDVAAGYVAEVSVAPGTAVKIMTGAPMPDGADTVVKVEDTRMVGDGAAVEILAPTRPGAAVRKAGGDVAAGTLVFPAGIRLGPAHLSVLASLGVAQPVVSRRPRIAYMTTGDELVSPDTEVLEPGQIRDSNRLTVGSVLAEFGALPIDVGSVRDESDVLEDALRDAADVADVVITTGGVSMGEHDIVKAVLREMGGVEFWKVAMQPGKPFAFGLIAGTPFFGLPGNPVSVMVAFEQFVRPAVLHMMGARDLYRPRVRARLLRSVDTNPAKTVFLRVRVEWVDDHYEVDLTGGQDSNVLSALARANAFAVIPVGAGHVEAGEEVDVELIRLEDGPEP